MADRAISELTQASDIYNSDLFVLEQNNTAKSMSWQTLITKTATALDGHGGISSITYLSPSAGSITGTLTITMADATTTSVDVKNGRGISSISDPVRNGLVDTYTVNYNDGSTTTFQVTNGAKGDKGDNSYVHIRYASQMPSADNPYFGVTPDAWMGIASTSSASAPTGWNDYKWYKIKGAAGDKGDNATIASSSVEYAYSESGDGNPPQSGWSESVPAPVPNQFLWTKTTVIFNTGDPIVSYGVSKIGSSGQGTGSVTRVTVSNAGLDLMSTSSVSITESGTVSIGHTNTTEAKTTQAVYPVTIDSHGHIATSGTAATASTLGAIEDPSDKESGQYLKYNGTSWEAGTIQIPETGVTNIKIGSDTYDGSVTLSAAILGAVPEPASKTAGQYMYWNGGNWATRAVETSAVTTVDCYTSSSSSNTLGEGSVTLQNYSGVKFFIVQFCNIAGSSPALSCFIYPNGNYGSVVCQSQGWGNNYFYKREITKVEGGKMYFTNGKSANLVFGSTAGNHSWNTSDSASAMVPYRIIGVK